DYSNTVRIFAVTTGKESISFKGHDKSPQGNSAVLAVAYAPDGKTLASAASDYTIRIWDAETAKQTYKCEGHVRSVMAVAFDKSGKVVARGGADNCARLWNAASG